LKQRRPMSVEIKCEGIRRSISDYVDGNLDASLRQHMDHHFNECKPCQAVLDGIRNVVELVADPRAFQVPPDLRSRLYSKLEQHQAEGAKGQEDAMPEIPIGITDDRVQLGSHLIYFWEGDEDFERGVRFLYPGLGHGEHCIVFGHDEALEKVLGVLRSKGFSPDELIRNRELTVLRRQASAQATVANIATTVEEALRTGASAIRFLGNLGMGRAPLPAGEDDVVELESAVSGLISALPCVVVCMYDVRTLSGQLILKGGLQTHNLAVCAEGIRENPYYAPEARLLPGIHLVH
jgi:hypothetical protein